MPTDRPRIQVTLDDKINGMLAMLAEQKNTSMSAIAAELIEEALELHEDIILSKHADERFEAVKKWYSHEDAWK